MEFEYNLIVQKKPNKFGKILALKEEIDGTQKLVPLFAGYQKATLYQSFNSAEKKRQTLNFPGINNQHDLYTQRVVINYEFELPPTK